AVSDMVASIAAGALSSLVEAELGSHFLLQHDLFRKPAPTPDQCRGTCFSDHAQRQRRRKFRVPADWCSAVEDREGSDRAVGYIERLGEGTALAQLALGSRGAPQVFPPQQRLQHQ